VLSRKAVAAGGSPPALIEQVQGELTQLLPLQSCRFQFGVAQVGQPARTQHYGRLPLRFRHGMWTPRIPPGTDTELLVESGGVLPGRFLMAPVRGAPRTLEQWLRTVAFADQAGTALTGSRPVEL
jgi:hypothetical protein